MTGRHTTISGFPTVISSSSSASSSSLTGRRVFGEKFMLALAFVAFCVMCFGALFFVPDLRPARFTGAAVGPHDIGTSENVEGGSGMAKNDVQLAEEISKKSLRIKQVQQNILEHRKKQLEQLNREKVRDQGQQQQQDQQDQQQQQDQQEQQDQQPDIEAIKKAILANSNNNNDNNDNNDIEEGLARDRPPNPLENQAQVEIIENTDTKKNSDSSSSSSLDEETKQRQQFVKEMMKHAWDGYAAHSWGHNEHMPNARRAHNSGLFGSTPLGATIVDSLDTLLIMGMIDEYKRARDWVANELNFKTLNSYTSVFETNIRWVGGLLAAYGLTHDEVFKVKAKEIADLLLPAFNTPTGLPLAMINLANGDARLHDWAGGQSILAEIGTLDIEFQYLSDITGNPIYREKVLHIRKHMKEVSKPDGLYPNYISPYSGHFGSGHVSLGGLGDSFYEYLLKSYLISGKKDKEVRAMYDSAMANVIRVMVPPRNKPDDNIWIAESRGGGYLDHKMDHLACFAGGMFALGAEGDTKKEHFDIGAGVTSICHDSYAMTATHIGPETFRIDPNTRQVTNGWGGNGYILRPEVVESYFVLWRLTHDQKYREWGWDAAQAINRHCRGATGFSGINDVNNPHPNQDDVQQSFFLAETLKYLYLLFSEDDLISLDDYVFNTEAHPLPVVTKRSSLKLFV